MKNLLALLAAMMLTVSGTVAAQHEHESETMDKEAQHSEHDQHGELALQRDNGERWATDEPLRRGMEGIRDAFAPHHRAYEDGHFERADAAQLADSVQEQVDFMFANCELPPKADAELHKLLAATIGATQSLREDDDLHAGLHQLHEVIRTYPEYFDHPGWDE